VVVDEIGETRNLTDLLPKCYNIWKINVTPYHAAANEVIHPGHRPIADAVSKLTACSDQPKGTWIDY